MKKETYVIFFMFFCMLFLSACGQKSYYNIQRSLDVVNEVFYTAERPIEFARRLSQFETDRMNDEINVRHRIVDLQEQEEEFRNQYGRYSGGYYSPPQRIQNNNVGHAPNGLPYKKMGCRYFPDIGQTLCPQ